MRIDRQECINQSNNEEANSAANNSKQCQATRYTAAGDAPMAIRWKWSRAPTNPDEGLLAGGVLCRWPGRLLLLPPPCTGPPPSSRSSA